MTFDSNKLTKPFRQANNFFIAAVLFLGLGACDNNSSKLPPNDTGIDRTDKTEIPVVKTAAAESAIYKYIDVKEKVAAAASPLGYWDITLHYPEVINLSDTNTQAEINSHIKSLVNKYKCPTTGEQTFASEVTLANRQLISFKYDAMWLCDAMPHPDSTTGATTIDLASGKQINIAEQAIDARAYDKLQTRIISEINKLLTDKKAAGTRCPTPDSYANYYLTNENIVFRASYTAHSDSACGVEAKLDYATLRGFIKPQSKLLVKY